MSKLSEALRKNRERSTKNFLPFYKFPKGKTDIRILPAAKGDDSDDWFVPVGMHYGVDEKRPINCHYETFWAEDPCPICEMVKELRSEGMNDDANRMSVRRQYLVRGIVRGEEDKGAQIIRLPSTLFQAIGEMIEDVAEYGNILSPGPKGRDIRVNKTGENLDTKYSAAPRLKPAMVLEDKAEAKELIAGLEPIAGLVSVPSFTEIEKVMNEKIGYTTTMGDSFDDDEDIGDIEERQAVEEAEDDEVDEPTGAVDANEVDDFFDDDEDEDDDDDENWLKKDDDDDDFDAAPEVEEEEEKPEKKTTVKMNLEEDLAKKHKVTSGKKRAKSRTKKKG